jgi:UDP-N-acetylglucosamine--N-acetylmuramyl-(pentapeptide) pyrophosphoryl-undecaprenol N-acetylglucosamine transferase
MGFVIAAAGTGGHVYPGLAVAEALVAAGVSRGDILCIGGDRVESRVFPQHGFEFLQLELRGLKRSLSPGNLSLPVVVLRARKRIATELTRRRVGAVLGMGGYVTVPVALAATKTRTPLVVSEQNAGAGLANRIAARWADRVFVSFPDTVGLPGAEWVGNPVRSSISKFDRAALREQALAHYGIEPGRFVLGVFGGSLGAQVLNEATVQMVTEWSGPPIQIVHLVGASHADALAGIESPPKVAWVRKGFEERMDLFYAACDLVVARAGGAVAEISATATPSILVPGEFGSAGHQAENAAFLERAGAAIVLQQGKLADLPAHVSGLMSEPEKLAAMSAGAGRIARPDAAKAIAEAMIEIAR